MPSREFIVDAEGAGQRLDVFLSARAAVTRSQVQRHIELGVVTVGGAPARASRALRTGEVVEYSPPPPAPAEAEPEDIPLRVLHEDEHLVVVDKPAGLVVHPAAGHAGGTLVNALLHHCGALSLVGGRMRPGIVHRLDKGTSGVMVISKSDAAHLGLSEQFSAHSVERAYTAITVGAPPSDRGSFDTLHGRHPVDRKRFTCSVTRGKRAVTHYEVLEHIGPLCLVRARLETGRTHQVRVHLSEHGAPLLGDPQYGRSCRDQDLRALAKALGRQALHAGVLGFVHPITREPLAFETPLPADMEAALAAARLLLAKKP
ncbi:MAG: RluA family pseudouridine synthase [Polyangia bacterium]|nr:RluA family pseudouridine synthase [Polyangia bacterium]